MTSIEVVRSLVGALLVTSGAAKLADLRGFEGTLESLRFPPNLTRTGAFALPLAEVGIGGGVFARLAPRFLDLPLMLLCLTFVIVGIYSAAAHIDAQCRCLGAFDRGRLGISTATRAGALALASVAILVNDYFGSEPAVGTGISTLLLLSSAGLAVTVWQCAGALSRLREALDS